MVRVALAALLLAASGCAARPVPYRFAGPLVSGVSLDDRAEHGRTRPTYDDGVTRRPAIAVAEVPGTPRPEVPASGPGHDVSGARTVVGDFPDVGAVAGGIVISRLPEPHRQDRARDGEARLELSGLEGVDDVRMLVGSRDGRGDVAFALAVAAQLVPDVGAVAGASEDGPALVERARRQGALGEPDDRPIETGDLLVFDRAVDGEPASLVAVALGRDERGVIEMLYLARGVVRRGFVDPARPKVRRDDEGRVVNTYLRHGKDWPPKGTRYLSGELLAHVIRFADR